MKAHTMQGQAHQLFIDTLLNACMVPMIAAGQTRVGDIVKFSKVMVEYVEDQLEHFNDSSAEQVADVLDACKALIGITATDTNK